MNTTNKTNFHTHSILCDGECTILTMAQTAHEHGFSILGFSGHAPLPFSTDWNMKREDLPQYFKEIEDAQKAVGKELLLLKSLEIDYIKGIIGPKTALYPELDYSIGSVHYINPLNSTDGNKLFAVDESLEDFDLHIKQFCNGDYEKAVALYYTALCTMIQEGNFTIAGHLDLIKKNNPNETRFSESSSFYKDAVMQVIDELAGTGIIAEINTGGIARGKTQDVYPAPWILKELRARNIPICLNADAHAPEHLYAYYERGLSAAINAGYSEQVVPGINGLQKLSL